MQTVGLSSEAQMPIIGLGTWQATDEQIEEAVATALNLGYRHIDTAFNYNNEVAIGRAIKKWIHDEHGTREDLFITTKLPHVGNRADDVERFLQLSLQRLDTDYVDLYLIHVPFGFKCDEETLNPKVTSKGEYELDWTTDHKSTWQALEEQVKKGRAKSIGVSNFNAKQLSDLYNKAMYMKPAVLQVELHAYLQQHELRKLCTKLNIAITAYSPLGSPGAKSHFVTKYNYSPENFPDILSHPTVKLISENHYKTPAQVLLRHLIQQNIVVIPKSTYAARIAENFNIFNFTLTADEMKSINKLDKGDDGRIFDFLFWKGVEEHPLYPFRIGQSTRDRAAGPSKKTTLLTPATAAVSSLEKKLEEVIPVALVSAGVISPEKNLEEVIPDTQESKGLKALKEDADVQDEL